MHANYQVTAFWPEQTRTQGATGDRLADTAECASCAVAEVMFALALKAGKVQEGQPRRGHGTGSVWEDRSYGEEDTAELGR